MSNANTRQASVNAVLARLDSSQQQALDRLFEWLRMPSISTDPAFDAACKDAAAWAARQLSEIGFTATVHPTPDKPIVVGYWGHPNPSAPRVLFYGHYDVQPVDPLDLWKTPPFEPRLADDPVNGTIIVGRGANDDKGQVMTFLEACRAWRDETGGLPVSVSVLLEGEEENGSSNLPAFLQSHSEELKADFVLVCDTGQWNRTTPAITTSLRGIAHIEVTVSGPDRDLHSGMYGGPAMNPIRALTRLLGEMYDRDGGVCIPGFYEGIVEPPPEQLAQWRALNLDVAEFLGEVGLSHAAGETGRSALEQLWSRPTAEINGIWGGYTGEGTKTVIPAQASAKLTFRLVPGQQPQKVLDGFEAYIVANLPVDCRATFKNANGSPAQWVDTQQAPMRRVAAGLEAEWGTAPILMGCGASIPVVGTFKSILGMDTVLAGFAVSDDGAHSPNEKYNLSSFTKGARSWARILANLDG